MGREENVEFYLLKEEEYFKTIVIEPETKYLYKEMCMLREMEAAIKSLSDESLVRGFCHLITGQEAIYVALKAVINKDKVVGSYRCHGLAYASGIPVKEIVCEVLGKYEGNCKGKGGSMHLYNDVFYGGHGIVGAQVSLGTGVAFGLKYKKVDGVCFTFYGDGASNQGQVFESFNMAKLWNLPIVFVCENNFYGMWTPEARVSSCSDYYKRGLNIPGIKINGNDIHELIRAFTFAKAFCISNGPLIIQIDTYRTCGHSCVDKGEFYRTIDEVHKKQNDDGLSRLKNDLLRNYSKDEIVKIETDVKRFVSKVCRDSVDSADPPANELFKDVLFE